MANSRLLGAWGEQIACRYLQKKRYRILANNYRCRVGEIDLICSKRQFLVFVEVKLRKSAAFGYAREYVGMQKQQKVRAAASLWLQNNPTDLQPRFDVIEIYAPDGIETEQPRIIHLEDAFQ